MLAWAINTYNLTQEECISIVSARRGNNTSNMRTYIRTVFNPFFYDYNL